MSADTTGSIERCKLDGLDVDVLASANLNIMHGDNNEAVEHSGGNSKKVTKRAKKIESLDLNVSATEAKIIEGLSKLSRFPFSVTNASGDTYRGPAFINIESYNTEDGKMTLTVTPKSKDGFVLFEG